MYAVVSCTRRNCLPLLNEYFTMSKATPPRLPGPSLYKMCVLGDGKTALTVQYTSHHFVEDYDPTIEDSYRAQRNIDGQAAVLDVLDTAGQEEFSALLGQWILQGEGFVLVYDVTSQHSFQCLSMYVREIFRFKDWDYHPGEKNGPLAVVVVGNKIDLVSEGNPREVSAEEAEKFASDLGGIAIETSAKTRYNIEEVFSNIVRLIRRDTARSTGDVARKKSGGKVKRRLVSAYGKTKRAASPKRMAAQCNLL